MSGDRVRFSNREINRVVPLDPWCIHVNVRWNVDVERQHDALADMDLFGAGRCRYTEMLGLYGRICRVHGCSELFRENVGHSIPLRVILFEILRDHHALGVKYVRARVWNSVERSLGRGFIQDAVSADDLRVRIGKQRKRDVLSIGEAFENRGAVVTDGRQSQRLLADFGKTLFQLDQLGFAIRSPIGRAEEDQNRPLGSHDGLKRLASTVLVGCLEVGNPGADGGSSLEISLAPERCCAYQD